MYLCINVYKKNANAVMESEKMHSFAVQNSTNLVLLYKNIKKLLTNYV